MQCAPPFPDEATYAHTPLPSCGARPHKQTAAQVLAKEYTAIREAGLELEGGYTPPITYITVLKRHRARLFPTDDATNDGAGNVRPGTCVDSGVSLACGFDFYLSAHKGIQVRPAIKLFVWSARAAFSWFVIARLLCHS